LTPGPQRLKRQYPAPGEEIGRGRRQGAGCRQSNRGPGNFYETTVLSGLPHDAPVARKEFFGPVAMLFTFSEEEEAIRLANDTKRPPSSGLEQQSAASGESGRAH